jgi:hypothetical protein
MMTIINYQILKSLMFGSLRSLREVVTGFKVYAVPPVLMTTDARVEVDLYMMSTSSILT